MGLRFLVSEVPLWASCRVLREGAFLGARYHLMYMTPLQGYLAHEKHPPP